MKKFKQTGSYKFFDKEKKGRPSKFSDEISAQLVAWVEEDRRCTLSKLSTMVKEQFDVDISKRTIRTFMSNKGYFGGSYD